MPELPEVETVRRCLEKVIPGRSVERVDVLHPDCIHDLEAAVFAGCVAGAVFGRPLRRGKYLVLPLDTGDLLVVHLRMTGRFEFSPGTDEAADRRHTHLIFHLGRGDRLRYSDTRRFGRFYLLKSRNGSRGPGVLRESCGSYHSDRESEVDRLLSQVDPGDGMPGGLRTLGPEPYAAEFDPDYLAGVLSGRRAPIKGILLRQDLVAGLGNIYVDESLHRAGIRPDTPGGELDRQAVVKLHQAIGEVLGEAVELRGTTFSDYRDAFGRTGDFRDFLRVYGRAGKECPACGTPIERRRLAGRGTHYCPHCQPAPKRTM